MRRIPEMVVAGAFDEQGKGDTSKLVDPSTVGPAIEGTDENQPRN